MDDIREIKITVPEGMEIDKENSTFECIKFKPIKSKRWRDNKNASIRGYYIKEDAAIDYTVLLFNDSNNYNVFATEKQAKSALAMARISQIMANDKRFGDVVTYEEWSNDTYKFCLIRAHNNIHTDCCKNIYNFLSFHTREQRDLFLEENEDLVKDYLMLE